MVGDERAVPIWSDDGRNAAAARVWTLNGVNVNTVIFQLLGKETSAVIVASDSYESRSGACLGSPCSDVGR
jgi:hypothetical protein